MGQRGEGRWDHWGGSDPPPPTAQVNGSLWAMLSPQTFFFGLPGFFRNWKISQKK